MERAIAALLAKQEIAETLYRIARGTDRGDTDLYAAGFHADGRDFHGLSNGPVGNTIANLAKTQLLLTQHSISNILIEFESENVAWVESLFTSFHQGTAEDGELRDETIRGRYFDRFERRGKSEWKIAQRVVLWDWSRIEQSGETWFDLVSRRPGADNKFIYGRRDLQDVSYTRRLPDEFEV